MGCDPSKNLKYAALERRKTLARAGGKKKKEKTLLRSLGNQWEQFYWMLEKWWPVVYPQNCHLRLVGSRNSIHNGFLALAGCFLSGQWKCHLISFCWMRWDAAGMRGAGGPWRTAKDKEFPVTDFGVGGAVRPPCGVREVSWSRWPHWCEFSVWSIATANPEI